MKTIINRLCVSGYKLVNFFPYTNSVINLGQRFLRYFFVKNLVVECGKPVTIGKYIDADWSFISIGYGSGIGNYSKIEGAIIGNNVLMGEYCNIYRRNHNFRDKKKLISEQGYSEDALVTIGNDVWIGDRVSILPGVRIGDGAVIGTCSVVTSDIEPYSIVVGNPVRTIGRRL